MTGRDLIMFILDNHLEDTIIVADYNGNFPGLISVESAAARWNTGPATVKALYFTGKIKGTEINNTVYILESQPNPFNVYKKG